jgi:GNAT superfamily N-acetyltransferase
MDPILRPVMPEDVVPVGTICYEAFKIIAEHHAFSPDFPEPDAATSLIEQMLSRTDVHGVLAEVDGRVIGSNFLWEDDGVAGVGPITIDPAAQNSGIGRKLMEAALERARNRGIARVRLVQAAYHARSLSLYIKLGFVVREPLSVMQGPPLNLAIDGHKVCAATAMDVEEANDLCQRVHGHARPGELSAAIEQGTATAVRCHDRLTGYATSIGFFGHAVGETTADLQALIGAARSFAGPGFLAPMRNAALMRWCLEQGLRIVQPMTLMTIGPYRDPNGAFLCSILY